MLDVVFKNGLIIDGTGSRARRADVGVRDGTIVAVGTIDEPTQQTFDADGRVVCPGFIDVHSHYDGQLLWDPQASPSPAHGVTTVLSGNCGFSLAPLTDESATYIRNMMARVEGIPHRALEVGVDWNWRTYGEWLAQFEGRIAVNSGFLVGHSTVRRAVMGREALERHATDGEITKMKRLIHEALSVGALGFSTSLGPAHVDDEGVPVPSRHASREELITLAAVVNGHVGTSLEMIPPNFASGFSDSDMDLLTSMSIAGGRPLNWNVLKISSSDPDFTRHQLTASDHAAERGGSVVALANGEVVQFRINLASSILFDGIPGWSSTMALPIEQRMVALADPAVRDHLAATAAAVSYRPTDAVSIAAALRPLVIESSTAPANAPYLNRSVGEVADDERLRPIDVLCDVALADGLGAVFRLPAIGDDDASWELRKEIWTDRRVIIGGSDAGAHLDMICGGTATTAFLRQVLDRDLMSLPRAIFELTGAPAGLYGLSRRGRISEGFAADIVVLDPDTVAPRPLQMVRDLPGDCERLIGGAEGIEAVFVNGRAVVINGRWSGETSGTVLRAGTDTSEATSAAFVKQPA